MILLFCLSFVAIQAQNINKMEYYYDSDPGFGNGTTVPVTAGQDIANLAIPIDISSISDGFHNLYIRARDVNGRWTATSSRVLYKIPAAGVNATSPNINKLEYYYDTDPGFGNGTNVPVTAGQDIANLAIPIDISSISDGFHNLYIRTRDVTGRWSNTSSRVLYKIPPVVATNSPNINQLEYYYDTDPGFGNGTKLSVSAGQDIANLAIPINISSVSDGFHNLYVRTRDAGGRWSITTSRVFYKNPAPVATNRPIVAVEYYFNTDPGFGNATKVIPPAGVNLANFAFGVCTATANVGANKLYVRSRDDAGRWTITAVKDVTITAPTTAPAMTISGTATICAGETANLSVAFSGGTAPYNFSYTDGTNAVAVSTSNNPYSISVTPTTTSTYTIVSQSGCTGAITGSGTVNVRPSPNLQVGIITTCQGETAILSSIVTDLNNTVGTSAYYATLADAESQTNAISATVNPLVTTTYFVRKNATGHPCFDIEAVTVTVGSSATANAGADQTHCGTGFTSLTLNGSIGGSAISLTWSGGAGVFSAATSLSSTYAPTQAEINAGSVTLTLTTDDPSGACTAASDNVVIYFHNPQGGTIGSNQSLCSGATPSAFTSLTAATGTNIVYQWEISTIDCNAGFSSIANATSLQYAHNQPLTQNTFFRRKVTSTLNGVACVAYSNCVSVSMTSPISLSANVNSAFICNGLANTGSVSLSSTGIAPFIFAYCNGANCTNFGGSQSSGNFNNLAVGTYTFRVSDGAGCKATTNATIQGINVALVSSENLTCYQNNTGQATFTASNGTAPYSYNIGFGAQNTTGVFTTLSAANHRVTVTDAGGCIGVSAYVNLTQPNVLSLQSSLTNLVNCTDANSGVITLNVSGGTTPYSYQRNGGIAQSAAAMTGLAVGAYSFSVTDAKGCTAIKDATMDTYSVSITGADGVCNGNSIALTASTNNTLTKTFLWSSGQTTASVSVSPIVPTTYSVTVTITSNGCATVATKNIVIYPKPSVTISNFVNLTCANNSTAQATAIATGGQQPYAYLWNQGTSYINGGTATGLGVGVYNVVATDALGCAGTSSLTVTPYTNPATVTLPTGATSYFSPANGTPDDIFNFTIKFTHPQNIKPKSGYPRLLMDYEGDGVYTGTFDRATFMLPAEFKDFINPNTTAGVAYQTPIYGLLNSPNWKYKIVVIDENDCVTEIGPFVGPLVQVKANVYVFADDISFLPQHPNPNEPIKVSVKVHNNSDFDVNNIVARLKNEFTGISEPNSAAFNVKAHGITTIEWTMTTPNVPSFNPIHVDIDWLGAVDEGNELDNHAARPFTNGAYNVPGGIATIVKMKPDTVCLQALLNDYDDKIYVNLSVDASYYGLAVPLADPSVAGADVNFSVTETGQQFSGFTNSMGKFNYKIKPPSVLGIYNIQGDITDFTLENSFTSYFVVASCPNYIPPPLPELAADITANAPFGDFDGDNIREFLVVEGNALTGINAKVKNSGKIATGQAFQGKHYTTTGSILQQDYTIPSLAINQSTNVSLPAMTFNTVGIHYLHFFTDSQFEIVEYGEDNNWSKIRIKVVPALSDIEVQNVTASPVNTDACTQTKIAVNFKNKGNQNTGNFDVELKIKDINNSLIATYVKNVTSVPFYNSSNAIFEHQFTTSGNYTFEVKCDYNNTVNESDETNNNSTINRNVVISVCQPNLVFERPVSDMRIYCNAKVIDPNVPTYPGMIDIGQTLYNTGKAPAVNPEIKLIITGSPQLEQVWTHNGTIPAGGSAFVHISIAMPTFGDRSMSLVADPNSSMVESNEADNIARPEPFQWEFNFGNSECGKGRYCKTSSCPIMWYDTAVVNVPVKPYIGIVNNGKFKGANVKTKFEVKGPGIPDWTDLGNTVSDMNYSCESCPFMVELPTPFAFPQSGAYQMRFTLDPNNEYSEGNESNNELIININIENRADFFVRSSRIDIEKLHPAVNDTVKWVRVTYENWGGSNVQDTVELKLLIDGAAVDSMRVPGLVHNAHATKQFNLNWSSALPGIHVIRAIIDADKQIAEVKEDNNEATRSIVVGDAPDLLFASFSATNNFPVTGELITFNMKIDNDGDFDCSSKLQLFYVNDNNIEVPITSQNIFVVKRNFLNIAVPWTVALSNTVIRARLVNSDPLEARSDNNAFTLPLNGLNVIVNVTKKVNCNAGSGRATAIIEGGNAPYTYAWSNGSIAKDATGFDLGNYTITVTDASGTTDVATFPMTAGTPTGINVNNVHQITCFGGSDGSITVSGKNGTTPYAYLWSNGTTTQLIQNLTQGMQTVTITDADNCTVTQSFTLTEPSFFSATATHTDISCNGGNNGSVTTTATGGVTPYTYVWTKGASTTNKAMNLAFGLWNVSIHDANGCYTTTGAIVLEPTAISPRVTITDAGCQSALGSATFNPTGGTPDILNGYTFRWNGTTQTGTAFSMTNLAAGQHPYTITDGNVCNYVGTIQIKQVLAGIANFTHDFEDKKVLFSNTSLHYVSQNWEFGDGGTSSDVNPTHTYSNYGKYATKLTITDSCGLLKIKYDTIDVIKYIAIRAKVFLGGAYVSNGLMDDYFRENGLLPLTEPYTAMGFNHIGGGGEMTTPAVLNNTNIRVIDWIFVELRDTLSPATVLATRTGLLLRNGEIVDVDGAKPLKFKYLEPRKYRVAIRHRNHLGFRMLDNIALIPHPVVTLDFRDALIPLYGNTSTVPITATLRAMISGDANSDGSVDAFDTLIWESENGLFDDYSLNSDYNLDGSADAFDTLLWEFNNGKFEELD